MTRDVNVQVLINKRLDGSESKYIGLAVLEQKDLGFRNSEKEAGRNLHLISLLSSRAASISSICRSRSTVYKEDYLHSLKIENTAFTKFEATHEENHTKNHSPFLSLNIFVL